MKEFFTIMLFPPLGRSSEFSRQLDHCQHHCFSACISLARVRIEAINTSNHIRF